MDVGEKFLADSDFSGGKELLGHNTPVGLSSKFEPQVAFDDQISFKVDPHAALSTSMNFGSCGHIYLNGMVLVASRKRENRILVAKRGC